jgi:hypothetical protein
VQHRDNISVAGDYPGMQEWVPVERDPRLAADGRGIRICQNGWVKQVVKAQFCARSDGTRESLRYCSLPPIPCGAHVQCARLPRLTARNFQLGQNELLDFSRNSRNRRIVKQCAQTDLHSEGVPDARD